MIFYDILKKCSWSALEKQLRKMYPEPEGNILGYKTVYETLCKMHPKKTDHMLFVIKEKWADEWEYHIYSRKKKDDEDVCYDIDGSWAELLGMEVFTGFYHISKLELVSLVLFNMICFGFTEEEIEEFYERLNKTNN